MKDYINTPWKLICLIGPSGCGKTTLMTDLKLPILRSTTTRPMRAPAEENEYIFITDAKFEEYKAVDAFVESIERAGYKYGILKSSLEEVEKVYEETGAPSVRIVTYEGYQALKECMPKGTVGSVFIHASYEECATRLRSRKITPEEYKERIRLYAPESLMAKICDITIPNHDLGYDVCLNSMLTIIRLASNYTVQ